MGERRRFGRRVFCLLAFMTFAAGIALAPTSGEATLVAPLALDGTPDVTAQPELPTPTPSEPVTEPTATAAAEAPTPTPVPSVESEPTVTPIPSAESEPTVPPESTTPPNEDVTVEPSSERASPSASIQSTDFGILSVCMPTASLISGLDFGTSQWIAGGYETVFSNLQISIEPGEAGCTGLEPGWNILVSASSLSSSETGSSIPSERISFIGSAPDSSPPPGVEPIAGSTITLGGVPIAITSEADPGGGVWSARFSLSPPDTTAPGTYTGTITVDVAQSSG